MTANRSGPQEPPRYFLTGRLTRYHLGVLQETIKHSVYSSDPGPAYVKHEDYLALRTYADSLKQDAERYRWFRVQRHADIAATWFLPIFPDQPVDTPEQRDRAIDAAMENDNRN